MDDLTRLGSSKYVLVTTFRKDGTPVPTPVWAARDGAELVVWTAGDSGKVKRIRRDGTVEVAECDLRGKPRGEAVRASARLLDAGGTAHAKRLIARKYGLLGRLTLWGSRLRRGERGTVAIALTLSPTKGSGEPVTIDPRMYTRFTVRARKVIVAAQAEARQARSEKIGTEHLVLGLLHQPDGLGARAIEALGVPADTLRAEIARVLPPRADSVGDQLPFTSNGEQAIALTIRAALRLGHDFIGTEHILLGILEEHDGPGARTLIKLGVTKDRAEGWLVPVINQLLRKERPAG